MAAEFDVNLPISEENSPVFKLRQLKVILDDCATRKYSSRDLLAECNDGIHFAFKINDLLARSGPVQALRSSIAMITMYGSGIGSPFRLTAVRDTIIDNERVNRPMALVLYTIVNELHFVTRVFPPNDLAEKPAEEPTEEVRAAVEKQTLELIKTNMERLPVELEAYYLARSYIDTYEFIWPPPPESPTDS